MEKKELAMIMDISLATVYNWEKTKPKLMELVKIGIEYKNGTIKEEQEINKYFRQLTDLEQEMYLSEIKARVIRKKIDN